MGFQIKEGCVGCHYCALECPVEAITFHGRGYQIEEAVCISCGKCRQVCHLSLPYDTAEQEKTEPSHPTERIDAEVVIIGAGGVGLGAAARASFLGRKTVLLEAGEHFGGGTYLAHGASFPGSKVVYPRLGLSSDVEPQVAFWNMLGKGRIKNQIRLRENVVANGAFLDWFDSLQEKNCSVFTKAEEGFPFPFDLKDRYLNQKSTDNSIGPGWTGSWICERLFEACMEQGVQYRKETRATGFLVDEGGNLQGVEAKDAGGNLQIYAKAIVLATGSYLMDDALIKDIDPDFLTEEKKLFRITVPTNRGDGWRMVKKIGGKTQVDFMRTRGPSHHPYSYGINLMMGEPENVFFGNDGERLFDLKPGPPPMPGQKETEDANTPGQKILHAKRGICYSILDQALLDILVERLEARADPAHDLFLKTLREEIQEECALEQWFSAKADTIFQLATKIGMDPQVLQESVEAYNRMCRQGEDSEFGKNPEHMHPIAKAPFYAFVGQNFENGASLGGVLTDGGFHVEKEEGGCFWNLYCAGDCATYDPAEDLGVVGLCGGLGGSFASGYQIANYIEQEHFGGRSNGKTM